MSLLALGLALLLGPHVFASLRPLRDRLVARIGVDVYRGLYSLATLVGLALTVWGFSRYRAYDWRQIWAPPPHVGAVALLIIWCAFVSLACTGKAPGKLRGWLRHPLLASVTLFSFGHLVAIGDTGGVLLFGALFVWSIYARIALKRRGDHGAPPSAGFTRADATALIVGTLLTVALTLLHPYLIGAPAING